jgi:branched-chain amino acid aminotransferase
VALPASLRINPGSVSASMAATTLERAKPAPRASSREEHRHACPSAALCVSSSSTRNSASFSVGASAARRPSTSGMGFSLCRAGENATIEGSPAFRVPASPSRLGRLERPAVVYPPEPKFASRWAAAGRYNRSMLQPTEKIWHNGCLIPWDEAKIHVLSHVVSYGSSVFEGIRCYETVHGPAIFRAADHMRRLVDSAKIYRMQVPYSIDQLIAAMIEIVRESKLRACYIRPIVLRGYGDVGVLAKNNPVETYIACYPWGRYLGEEALNDGVDVCVSSWNRFAPNTLPALSKAGGNYLNSQLIRMEAALHGYAEGIALDTAGYVSEGSGENIFVIRDGSILTPPLATSVLPGITRDTVIKIAAQLGMQVVEAVIPRELLYIADEVFFTGTAAEVTPIRTVDQIPVGTGHRGPITERIQQRFFEIVKGSAPDEFHWLTPVTGVPEPVNA